MTSANGVISAGYGVLSLHLGQFKQDVESRFGRPPETREASRLRTYWIYPDEGFDCIISAKSDRVLSLFFFADSCDGHREAAHVVTAEGINFGATVEDVLKVYGPPYKRGGDFKTAGGDYIRKWVSFRTGIGFHFGIGNNVEVISVFRRAPTARRVA